jgi:hypothetical protein
VIELTKVEQVESEARSKEYTSPYRDVMRACCRRAKGVKSQSVSMAQSPTSSVLVSSAPPPIAPNLPSDNPSAGRVPVRAEEGQPTCSRPAAVTSSTASAMESRTWPRFWSAAICWHSPPHRVRPGRRTLAAGQVEGRVTRRVLRQFRGGPSLDTKHPAIRETLRGIERKHGNPLRRAAAITTDRSASRRPRRVRCVGEAVISAASLLPRSGSDQHACRHPPRL